MTPQPDVLEQARRALRDAYTGERQGSGFTRARIMASLYRDRRRRLLRWVVFSPLASVLLVGSAWAHSTGKWPVIWKAVASVLGSVESTPTEPKGRRSTEPASSAAPPESPALPEAALPEPPTPPQPAVPDLAVAPATKPSEQARPPRANVARRRSAAPKASEAPPEATPDPEPSQPDPELGLFRRAHDLHVSGRSPGAAILAYDEYLAQFPHGRFVPEAHYNSALDHIKLGDKARARRMLEPFARGVYGDYRRTEAAELIEALR